MTGLARSAWRFGSKLAWRGRLGRLDRLVGLNDESDEMNMIKIWDWIAAIGMLVQKWLGGVGLAGFIIRVDPMMNLMRLIR